MAIAAPVAGGTKVTLAKCENLSAGGLLKVENCKLMSQKTTTQSTRTIETNVKSRM